MALIKKIKIYLFLILLLFGASLVLKNDSWIKPNIVEIENNFSTNPGINNPEEEATSLLFIGDIMLNRGVEFTIEKNGENWNWPFLSVADELKKADIVVGNLESPISDKGEKVGSIYSFRANPKSIEGLVFAGFDVLSVANNHALDYGKKALEDTLTRLKTTGIDYIGGGLNSSDASLLIKDIHNSGGLLAAKIGFLAYTNLCQKSWSPTETTSGINCVSESDFTKIKQEISEAKSKTDILIVSLHAGNEYSPYASAFQISFSKMAIDAGADLIIGHHPHVVQNSEVYKGKYIFYSLGNFVFDQGFSKETMEGEMVKVLIDNKKITTITPIKIQINKSFQPEIVN